MESPELIGADDALRAAIREDLGTGDLTSRSVVPEDVRASGSFVSKQDLVVAGLPVVARLAHLFDTDLHFEGFSLDGDRVSAGHAMARIRGSARSILSIERTALNLLQRMCGIATLTADCVERVRGTRARIVDTRKTAPGLRVLDKYAVRCGGGMNHRMGLFDGVLIKNNHIAFHSSVSEAVREARHHVGHLVKIEAEVRSLDELTLAITAGADVVLLDNMPPAMVAEAVRVAGGRVPLEASGGITLKNIREYAETGVDYISMGVLTHSVRACDIHLRVAI